MGNFCLPWFTLVYVGVISVVFVVLVVVMVVVSPLVMGPELWRGHRNAELGCQQQCPQEQVRLHPHLKDDIS